MLNKQGPKKIDWTDWTWNPISGCLHGCEYCYMKRLEKRFSGIMQPKSKPEYLRDLKSKKIKPGDKIFVGSSGDMWGDWVSDGAIADILCGVEERPDIIFQFLTKNPIRYSNFRLDNMCNCWFGTSLDGTYKTFDNLPKLINSLPEKSFKFASFEPLITRPMVSSNFYKLDWIIIGADSNKGAVKPPQSWADFLIREARESGIPVWVKDNYNYPEKIKEFPFVKSINHGRHHHNQR